MTNPSGIKQTEADRNAGKRVDQPVFNERAPSGNTDTKAQGDVVEENNKSKNQD